MVAERRVSVAAWHREQNHLSFYNRLDLSPKESVAKPGRGKACLDSAASKQCHTLQCAGQEPMSHSTQAGSSSIPVVGEQG